MTAGRASDEALAYFLILVIDTAFAAEDEDFAHEAENALGLCRAFLADMLPPAYLNHIFISPKSGTC